MKKGNWIWLVLFCASMSYLFWAYSALPDKVAIHFNWKGQADSWAPKDKAFFLLGGILWGMNILGLFLYKFIRKMPPEIVNLPWKDYWFAPERREIAYEKLQETIAWGLGIFTNIILLFGIHYTVQENGIETLRLPFQGFLAITILCPLVLLTAILLNFKPSEKK